jgi:hypothetical protein
LKDWSPTRQQGQSASPLAGALGSDPLINTLPRRKFELDRRITAHESQPNRGSSWNDVKKRLLGE